MKKLVKKVWYDENSTPPINYIWIKGGKEYEWDKNSRTWVVKSSDEDEDTGKTWIEYMCFDKYILPDLVFVAKYSSSQYVPDLDRPVDIKDLTPEFMYSIQNDGYAVYPVYEKEKIDAINDDFSQVYLNFFWYGRLVCATVSVFTLKNATNTATIEVDDKTYYYYPL